MSFFAHSRVGGDKRDRTANRAAPGGGLADRHYLSEVSGSITHDFSKTKGHPGGCPFCFGGDKRDRTADLLNAIQALSQLSYTPIFGCCDRSIASAQAL